MTDLTLTEQLVSAARRASARYALAKAWDEGHLAGVEHGEGHRVTRANPYREVVVDGE